MRSIKLIESHYWLGIISDHCVIMQAFLGSGDMNSCGSLLYVFPIRVAD